MNGRQLIKLYRLNNYEKLKVQQMNEKHAIFNLVNVP